MRRMIDEPTQFDSLEVWEKFLSDLESIVNKDVNTRLAIENARRVIEEKKK